MFINTVRTAHTSWTRRLALDLALTTAGALGLAVLSKVYIDLPYVPITLHVMGVLLLGGLLGPRLGAMAILEYLFLGLCGAPVFAGPHAGPGVLLGTTGGYLFAFAPAAMLYGTLVSRLQDRPYIIRMAGAIAAALPAIVVIYAGGWAWLTWYLHEANALRMAYAFGILPFIGLDLVKAVVAAAVLALRAKG